MRVVVGESRVMGKGKGQVFRFRFRPSRARRRSRRFRDRDVYARNTRREKKRATLFSSRKKKRGGRPRARDRSSVALNAGRGPFKPLKVAARNRPRDASSDAETPSAARMRSASPTASRRARPRRHDLRCARSGRSRRRRDALRTQPRAHARVLNAFGARNADTRESGGYRVRGGRQSSARGRRDPKERREIPENAGWSTPLTFRGVCSGNTHLVSGAWPAFGCAPVVAIVECSRLGNPVRWRHVS